MEERDRKKIVVNLPKLINKTKNFDQVFKILIDKKMFNEHMIKEIQVRS